MTETNKTNILNRLTEGIAHSPAQMRFAGYNAWHKFDRFVRKGEKSIWILAPNDLRMPTA